jgi:ribosomal protein S18 acetylase RimI-like enzyme
MILRIAQHTDAAQLSELNREFNDSSANAEQIADYLKGCPDNEKTVVAELDGKLVGFGCLQIYRSWCYPEPWAELTEMFVAPEFQRRGFGQAIALFIEQVANDAGATEIVLLTGKRNVAGQSLYRKCGYTEQARCSFHKELKADS